MNQIKNGVRKRYITLQDKALDLLQKDRLTYKELAVSLFDDDGYEAMNRIYGLTNRLRKKGFIYLPIAGNGSTVGTPANKTEARNVLSWQAKSALGRLRGFMRVASFLKSEFELNDELHDIIGESKEIVKL